MNAIYKCYKKYIQECLLYELVYVIIKIVERGLK